jgi:hypothetical protein
MTDRVEKGTNVGVQNPVHLHTSDCRRKPVQRIVLASLRSVPIREPQEVFFIDCIEYFHQRTLGDFIFQRSNTERALPPIRFLDLLAPRWQCSIRAPMNAGMQVHNVGFKVLRIILPRDPVHPRHRIPLEPEIGILE